MSQTMQQFRKNLLFQKNQKFRQFHQKFLKILDGLLNLYTKKRVFLSQILHPLLQINHYHRN